MALSLTRLRRTIALFSVIMAGALILAIAPAAISADDDPKSIEQFQPITISEDTFFELEAVAEDLDPLTMLMIFMQLEDLGEFDTNLDEHSFSEASSRDEVNDHLNGELSEPGYLPSGFSEDDAHFGIGEPGYASATINVSVARNISELLDLPPEWLPDPAEHETVTMSVDVPASGMIGYHSGFDKLMVGQVGMPEINIPDEVDLDLLREAIIDDPRMPNELADQLGAIDNWDETVPVPVPEGAEYEDLEFNGNPGFMLTMDREGAVIVWEANGTLHFVGGNLDADELEQIAESMQ
jgi:hypothetical protein